MVAAFPLVVAVCRFRAAILPNDSGPQPQRRAAWRVWVCGVSVCDGVCAYLLRQKAQVFVGAMRHGVVS